MYTSKKTTFKSFRIIMIFVLMSSLFVSGFLVLFTGANYIIHGTFLPVLAFSIISLAFNMFVLAVFVATKL